MRIAVNTRLLLHNRLEGIGWFMHETLSRICRQHPDDQFFFLFDRPWDDSFIFAPNVTPIVVHPQARHPFLYYTWFELCLPGVLKRIRPDVFLSPDGYLPLRYPGKMLAVFHDLNFEHYPHDIPWLERWYYRHFFPRYARRADRIATVSAYSRNDIITLYKAAPEKIDIVYNGVHEAYRPLASEQQDEVRTRYTDGKPYFLFVGSLHPRKNLARLFMAFDSFREACDTDIRLVIVGAKKWWTPAIREAYEQMKHQKEVVFTGRLAVSELQCLMASAMALTYVSYFEGFGIPILEAFASQTPVITQAMRAIAEQPDLRAALNEKAAQRLKSFSWQQSADLLYASICRTYEQE